MVPHNEATEMLRYLVCGTPINMSTSQHFIQKLNLEAHPEGGYYRRIYQSTQLSETPRGKRHSATAIHYLLERHGFSAWHRIQHDEIWFFHQGAPLIIRTLDPQGILDEFILGTEHELSICVPGKTWFCSEPMANAVEDFSLVSCVVSPGFDFDDFEMGNADALIAEYPQHTAIIQRLCRG